MTQPLHIVINAHAGALLHLSQESLVSRIREALPDSVASLTFAEGGQIQSVIAARLAEGNYPVLIGGGDGSIAAAAIETRARDVPLGVLPLGTMNLLAHDIGAAPPWDNLLPRYARPSVRRIDAGQAGDRLFLCCAVIGIVPETALKREAARRDRSLLSWAEFAGALASGLTGQEMHRLTLTCNGETFTVDVGALVISNNAFQSPQNADFRYRRAALDSGLLTVYGIRPRGFLDGLRLTFKLWNGAWHEDETVFSFETRALTVSSGEPDILVSVDGEPVTMSTPVPFRILAGALPILVPEASAGAA